MASGKLSINSENIFPIIKKWLYSDKDIFIREIISNAQDAITKYEKLATLGEAGSAPKESHKIEVILDKKEKSIKITDTGIGMTEEEIDKYINQIAFSGAKEFLDKYAKDSKEGSIIGHFGLGFYSSFMVSTNVTIDTLSYKEGSSPVLWECSGDTEYSMSKGTRSENGTTITMFINDEGKEFLDFDVLKNILTKYCNFMSYPIYLKEEGKDDININPKLPLFSKDPKKCTDEEYKEFYHENFMDLKEPLFWIHLNMDYPVKLKGILYFPKFTHEYELNEGKVKLYCNNVYVADNIKEIIPEFLLVLKGMIDCPELPLNVSRSFLQQDEYVNKISTYIIKKVSDKLKSLHKKDFEEYKTISDNLNTFIKYGCMREESFYDKIKDILLFKTINDEYVTLKDFTDRISSDEYQKTIYYATDLNKEAMYIKLFKDNSEDALVLSSAIDAHFTAFLETKNPGIRFARIDSNVNSSLKDGENQDDASKETADSLKEIFSAFVPSTKDINIKLEGFKTPDISAMILISENSRRMQEMLKMYGESNPMMNMPIEKTLVLNKNNDLIKYLIEHKDNKNDDKYELICNHIYDIARLSSEELTQDEMYEFINRNQKLLKLAIS